MPSRAYTKAIHKELGEDISDQLKSLGCEIIINEDSLKYSFENCPEELENRILRLKVTKGDSSLLNEFVPLKKFRST